MYKYTSWILCLQSILLAQNFEPKDSIKTLAEKNVWSKKSVWSLEKEQSDQRYKQLGTEEKLASEGLQFSKRGGFNEEVKLNGFSTQVEVPVFLGEMPLNAACTDHMDPTTSQVSGVSLNSASANKTTAKGANLGLGQISLNPNQPFWNDSLVISLSEELSSVDYGTHSSFRISQGKEFLFWEITGLYERRMDYLNTQGEKVDYSLGSRKNIAGQVAIQKNDITLSALGFYDLAEGLGFPSLAMDVGEARSYHYQVNLKLDKLGSSVGFGDHYVYHLMDDSTRDSVWMRMDMPGASQTYSTWYNQKFRAIDSLRYRTSFTHLDQWADMTMFFVGASDMYMQTRPYYLRTSWDHSIYWNGLKASFGWMDSRIDSDLGRRQLQIINEEKSQRGDFNYGASYEKSLNFNSSKVLNNHLFQVAYEKKTPHLDALYGYYIVHQLSNTERLGDPDLESQNWFLLNFSGEMGEATLGNLSYKAWSTLHDNTLLWLEDSNIPVSMLVNGGVVTRPHNKGYSISTGIAPNWEGLLFESKSILGQVSSFLNLGFRYEYAKLLQVAHLYETPSELEPWRIHSDFKLNLLSSNQDFWQFKYQYRWIPKPSESAWREPTPKGLHKSDLSLAWTLNRLNLRNELRIENIWSQEGSTASTWPGVQTVGRNFELGVYWNW
jgi:hypothetical protein